MNFICDPCKNGADIKGSHPLAIEAKKNYHRHCKGSTWCSCQHKIGAKTV